MPYSTFRSLFYHTITVLPEPFSLTLFFLLRKSVETGTSIFTRKASWRFPCHCPSILFDVGLLPHVHVIHPTRLPEFAACSVAHRCCGSRLVLLSSEGLIVLRVVSPFAHSLRFRDPLYGQLMSCFWGNLASGKMASIPSIPRLPKSVVLRAERRADHNSTGAGCFSAGRYVFNWGPAGQSQAL
jgi:hypothetical protein